MKSKLPLYFIILLSILSLALLFLASMAKLPYKDFSEIYFIEPLPREYTLNSPQIFTFAIKNNGDDKVFTYSIYQDSAIINDGVDFLMKNETKMISKEFTGKGTDTKITVIIEDKEIHFWSKRR